MVSSAHIDAHYNIGEMLYAMGEGVNKSEAVKWFKRAAEKGHARAHNTISASAT